MFARQVGMYVPLYYMSSHSTRYDSKNLKKFKHNTGRNNAYSSLPSSLVSASHCSDGNELKDHLVNE